MRLLCVFFVGLFLVIVLQASYAEENKAAKSESTTDGWSRLRDKVKEVNDINVKELKANSDSTEAISEIDKEVQAAVYARSNKLEKAYPLVPIGERWSLSVPVFVELFQVRFGDTDKKDSPTVDTFQSFTGVGSGVKFCYNYFDSEDMPQELFSLDAGLIWDPNIQYSIDNVDKTAQNLSAFVGGSVLRALYVGVGYTFASSQIGYVRDDLSNLFLLFGVGTDGTELTN